VGRRLWRLGRRGRLRHTRCGEPVLASCLAFAVVGPLLSCSCPCTAHPDTFGPRLCSSKSCTNSSLVGIHIADSNKYRARIWIIMATEVRSWFMTRGAGTYGVCSVFHAGKVYHAVEAGVAGAATLVTMWVEFLLCEDVAAGLECG
jgi:hypothetical protein